MLARTAQFLDDFAVGLLASSIRAIVVVSFAVAIARVYTGLPISPSEMDQLKILVLAFAFVDTFIGYVMTPLLKYASDRWERWEAQRAG